MRLAAVRDLFRAQSAHVAYAAAPVFNSVGVEHLTIESRLRNADAIVVTDHRSEVANHQHQILSVTIIASILASADEREHAGVGVVAVDPFKTLPGEVHFMKCGPGGVETI